MKNAISGRELSRAEIESLVMTEAQRLGVPQEVHIEYVCRGCCDNPALAPDIRSYKGNEQLSDQACVKKWVAKFYNSYKRRIERCKLKETKTVPDPALQIFLSAIKIKGTTKWSIPKMIAAHRLAMSAENIIGNMLELFLFEELKTNGWGVAWGSTISHVDFCSADGVLLQVKNRDNSENSSSRAVRDNHNIHFWYRSKSKSEETNWPELHSIIGDNNPAVSRLTEENFQRFIVKVLNENQAKKKVTPRRRN